MYYKRSTIKELLFYKYLNYINNKYNLNIFHYLDLKDYEIQEGIILTFDIYNIININKEDLKKEQEAITYILNFFITLK